MPTIAVLGTFDTKGPEHAFVADRIRAREARIIDEGNEYNYVHNIDGKKKKSVFISEHW